MCSGSTVPGKNTTLGNGKTGTTSVASSADSANRFKLP